MWPATEFVFMMKCSSEVPTTTNLTLHPGLNPGHTIVDNSRSMIYACLWKKLETTYQVSCAIRLITSINGLMEKLIVKVARLPMPLLLFLILSKLLSRNLQQGDLQNHQYARKSTCSFFRDFLRCCSSMSNWEKSQFECGLLGLGHLIHRISQ